MRKKVSVKPHLRGGKAVAGHHRTVDSAEVADKTASATMAKTSFDKNFVDDDAVGQNVLRGVKIESQVVSGRLDMLPGSNGNPDRLESCAFDGVVFQEIDLRNKEFVNCTFRECAFYESDFSNSLFQDCTFETSNITGQNINPNMSNDVIENEFWQNTVFRGCKFSKGLTQNVYMNKGGFYDCSFDQYFFYGSSHFNKVELKKCDFHNVNMRTMNLSGSVIEECSFDNTTFDSIGKHKPDSSHLWRVLKAPSPFKILKSRIENCVFQSSNFKLCEIVDSLIRNTGFTHVEGFKTSFEGSTGEDLLFQNSPFPKSSFVGCHFKRVKFELYDLTGASWENSSVELEISGNPILPPGYDRRSFDETIAATGLSEREFEYLVLAGAIEVRDNAKGQRVSSRFDPDLHHVPNWVYVNLPRILAGVREANSKP